MRRVYLKAALLSLTGTLALRASEIKTPLPFEYGYMRYPIEYHQEREKENWCFGWEVRGVGYARDADYAFPNCDSTCKVPFPTLIFGKESFTFAEAFQNAGVGVDFSSNPFIAISTITPKFDYHEKGAIFMADVDTTFCWCDTDYRLGFRAFLPVRDIRVDDLCGLDRLDGGLDINDVYRVRDEEIGDQDPSDTATNAKKENRVFAARLDFVSQLLRMNTPEEPLVVYGTGVGSPTKMADVTVGVDVNDDGAGSPSIALIQSNSGAVPVDQRWGDRVIAVGVPPLSLPSTGIVATVAGNGSGLTNGQRGKFNASNNYTALSNSPAAQSKLWVVPTLQGPVGADNNNMSTGATQIAAEIAEATTSIPNSVVAFIEEAELNFCDGRTKGLGDLILELYFGRNWGCDNRGWTDLVFAVSFPTGDKLCDCKQLLKQPLGNDGHFEIRGGIAGGYDYSDRFKFMADVTFCKVLSENQRVAAPFKGATIKGIGPCINADIDWWYLVGHADISVFATDCCGFDFGYEGYYKDCDNVCLCQTTATDLLGNENQPLDASILSKNTKRVNNKLRVGFFSILESCEIFGGWSQSIAGKNSPVDTDWYLSMAVRF